MRPVTTGGHHPGVDRVESVVQAPSRFLKKQFAYILDDDCETTPEQLQKKSLELSQFFLSTNGLEDVYIDVDCYEPSLQWLRLRENDSIAPIWKYTGGTLSIIRYSLLPRRAFHSDDYDPYTNTLSINSYRPASALYEAGTAKQFHQSRWRGTYAISQHLPVFPLFHHSQVTQDVLTFANANELWDIERELYSTAYAKLATSAVTQVLYVVKVAPGESRYFTPLLRVVLRGAGHLTGRTVANREQAKRSR